MLYISLIILQIIFMLFFLVSFDLHSFPTRRSSDLQLLLLPYRLLQMLQTPFPLILLALSPFFSAFSRSEEHTSELQSRGQLVSRLLLEKKNTYITLEKWFTKRQNSCKIYLYDHYKP